MGDVIELAGWLTAEQTAETLGIPIRYLYRIGKYLPPSKIGRALVYRREDVEKYAAEHPNLGKRASTA